MRKIKIFVEMTIISWLLLVNLFPIVGTPVIAESGAPDVNGVTTITWYINSTDDVSYNNDEFWTKDIQINSSGKMNWDTITAYINGTVRIEPDAFFNLTDCFLNLSGDLVINGTVNFDNVILIMNSSYDNEFSINVNTTGNFNVLNNSNITAYDTTTPIDVLKKYPGNESWGYHYNFTVYGNITINDSYVSYTYGNPSYVGGIHLYETARGIITNSTIYENEVCAIYIEGNTGNSHIIRKNHIYNATSIGIALFNHANATIDDNTIETYLANYGFGIICIDHCDPLIIRNTIRNNRYDGIYLEDFCNATIQNNTISNNQQVGIHFRGRVVSISPSVITTICYPKIYGNDIINNYEYGIYDLSCPAEISNNTISHTSNSSGIFVHNFISVTGGWVGFACWGNISDNTIKNNDHYGINISSDIFPVPYIVTMTVKNNTVVNNNWSGIQVIGGRITGTQHSPMPIITLNNISYNNHSGIKNYESLNYQLLQNTIIENNQSGILCESSSRPRILNRNIIRRNKGHGIESTGSRPNINDNSIINNDHSGVYVEGGSNAVNIQSNDITYNAWSGVEGNSTSVMIRDNNITNNSQNGIKLTGGAPTISQDNIANYNTWNGLACYSDSRPQITDSSFRYNGKNGIYLDNSHPTIGTEKNLITNNNQHGISCVGGTSGTVKADILSNTLDGIFTADSGTNIEILNSDISNNLRNGVNATANSNPSITNSTIASNMNNAFWLDGSADPISLNTTFSNNSVYYKDTASTLTKKWYLRIRTQTPAGLPLTNCKVWVNSSTQSQVIWSGKSNYLAEVKGLKIIEYVEKDSNSDHDGTDGGERIMWTPHDISGDKRDYRETHITPMPVIDHSQTIILKLDPNRTPFKTTNIKPTSTHNSHPTISWNPATDPDPGHVVGYQLWIGSNLNGSDVFEHNTLLTATQFPLPIDLPYESDGNKTYHITVISNDQHGGESYSYQELFLLNSPPTKPEINLALIGTLSENLIGAECEITTSSVDPDGDQINYTYNWYKNDKEQTKLEKKDTDDMTDTISINTDEIEFVKGDVWEVKVYATDGLNAGTSSMSAIVNATFTIGNLGPEINNYLNDITMDEDTELINAIDLTEAFLDQDQIAGLIYKSTVSDENLSVTINKNTYEVSLEPAPNWNGDVQINFTCIDSEGEWATQIVNVKVRSINDEPEFKEIGNTPITSGILQFVADDAATEEEWFNLTIIASDIDLERGEDDNISFEVSNKSVKITQWLDNPLKATLSYLPSNEDVGFFEFTISIKDKAMKEYGKTMVIKIEVLNANDNPILLSLKEISTGDKYPIPSDHILDLSEDINLYENDELLLLVTAIDPDSDDELTFHTDNLNIVEIDLDTDNPNTAKIIITPQKDSIGFLYFNITVKDRKMASDTVQVIFEVQNVNDKPVVKIISPPEYDQVQVFSPGQEITFEGSAEDPDIPYGDSLVYKWISDKNGELGDNNIITVSDLIIGEHQITFTAEDSYGESSSIKIYVIIGGRDKDSDNLPDDWEIMFFDSYMKYKGDDDPDGDKYTNSEEYLAESNPTDINDPEEQPKKEEMDIVFISAVAGMVIIVIIVLLILFLFMRKMRKKKAEELEQKKQASQATAADTGEKDLYAELYGNLGATAKKDSKTTPPGGLPMTNLPMTGPGAKVPMGYVPPQITTCPKCNTIMTFSPDGGMFCIKCGYKSEQ